MQQPLSGFEKAFCLSEPRVPINFAITARFAGEPDEAALRKALLVLRDFYPMAAIRLVKDEHGEPCFSTEGVDGFPLKVIDQAGDDEWQKVVGQELGDDFDLAHGPLVRAVLLKRSAGTDLILTFHHGIADGMSAVYFLRDLLSLVQDPTKDLPVMARPDRLLDRIPAKVKESPGVKMKIAGMKTGLWLMQHIKPFASFYAPADRLIDASPPWQHFRIASRCLTPAQTSHLALRCREEGTSVHAALSAAWLRARLAVHPDRKGWKRTISSPVNLRGQIQLENTFGMVMSNAITTVDCSPERGFWDVAREMKRLLQQESQTGRVYHWLLTMYGLMDLPLNTLRRAVPIFATQPLNYDFSMSNLGQLPIPLRAGSLELEAVYGPVVNTSEQELTVGIATVLNRLTMTLTFRDFVLNPVDAQSMADKAIDILGQAAGW